MVWGACHGSNPEEPRRITCEDPLTQANTGFYCPPSSVWQGFRRGGRNKKIKKKVNDTSGKPVGSPISACEILLTHGFMFVSQIGFPQRSRIRRGYRRMGGRRRDAVPEVRPIKHEGCQSHRSRDLSHLASQGTSMLIEKIKFLKRITLYI